MYQPASPLSGQCQTYTRKANGTYVQCRNRAAVSRNGKPVCYGCNQRFGMAKRDMGKPEDY